MILDSVDIVILDELQEDSKQAVKKIADKVGLSVTPVHERIRKLESSNIIDKYVAVVNEKLLGKSLVAYCQVKLIKQQEELYQQFNDYIKDFDEIMEAYYMAGNYDILLKIVLEDMDDYQKFVLNKLSKLDIIMSIQSAFAMSSIKKTNKVRISEQNKMDDC